MKKWIIIILAVVVLFAIAAPEEEGDQAWFDGVGQCEFVDGEWRQM